jgi:hypothetical protein
LQERVDVEGVVSVDRGSSWRMREAVRVFGGENLWKRKREGEEITMMRRVTLGGWEAFVDEERGEKVFVLLFQLNVGDRYHQ